MESAGKDLLEGLEMEMMAFASGFVVGVAVLSLLNQRRRQIRYRGAVAARLARYTS